MDSFETCGHPHDTLPFYSSQDMIVDPINFGKDYFQHKEVLRAAEVL